MTNPLPPNIARIDDQHARCSTCGAVMTAPAVALFDLTWRHYGESHRADMNIAADIVKRHRPILFSASEQVYICGACSLPHAFQVVFHPVVWPCPDRAAVGREIDDPSNALLPTPEETP